jgi:hypothetical protein
MPNLPRLGERLAVPAKGLPYTGRYVPRGRQGDIFRAVGPVISEGNVPEPHGASRGVHGEVAAFKGGASAGAVVPDVGVSFGGGGVGGSEGSYGGWLP